MLSLFLRMLCAHLKMLSQLLAGKFRFAAVRASRLRFLRQRPFAHVSEPKPQARTMFAGNGAAKD